MATKKSAAVARKATSNGAKPKAPAKVAKPKAPAKVAKPKAPAKVAKQKAPPTPAKPTKGSLAVVTHDLERSALKQVGNIALRKDAAGRVWVLGIEGRDPWTAVAYRFDGPRATRFAFVDENLRWQNPIPSFASAGNAAYLATDTGVIRIEGDLVEQLPKATTGAPRTLGASADAVYSVFTPYEGAGYRDILQLVARAWKPFAGGFDHLRSTTWFGDGLIVIENGKEKSYVYGANGKRRGTFVTYRSAMNVVIGATRFATLTDSVVEIRAADGASVAVVQSGEVGKLVGDTVSFVCGTALAGDELLLFASSRTPKTVGYLIHHDVARGTSAVHAHSGRLTVKSSAYSMAVDTAGAIWLDYSSWDGKTLLVIIDPDGTATTIKK